jgi:hypothetical protein
MGLIDPNIVFQSNPNAMAEGANSTLGLISKIQQMGQQRTDRSRTDAARQAFAQAAQGEDITSPDGMKRTIQKFVQAGFPQEAEAVFAAHKDMFPQPEYDPIDMGKAGYGVFNKRDASLKPLTNPSAPGQPFYSKEGQKAVDHDTKLAGFQKDLTEKYGAMAASLGTDVKKRNALVSEIYQKYGDLPEAQKFIDDTKNTPASIVNLGNGGLSAKDRLTLENRFRVDWGKEKRAYETQAQAYMNLKGIQSSKTYGTGIGDQALIDEFVRLQTGGRPTEAQYAQAISSFGLGDLVNKITGKVKSGAKLSEQQRQDILAAADEQMKNNHERLLSLKDEKEQELRDSGGEPKHVFQSSKYFDQVGKYFKESPAAAAPSAVKPHPQDSEAVQWARNPKSPGWTQEKAAAILKANGQ